MIELRDAAIKILVTNEATVWGQHDVVAVMVRKRGIRAIMPDLLSIHYADLLSSSRRTEGAYTRTCHARHAGSHHEGQGGLDGKTIVEILPRRQRPFLQSIMSGRARRSGTQ